METVWFRTRQGNLSPTKSLALNPGCSFFEVRCQSQQIDRLQREQKGVKLRTLQISKSITFRASREHEGREDLPR